MATRVSLLADLRAPFRHWPAKFFAVALVLGLTTRGILDWPLPFWIDEAFTGTIAAQPDAANLLRWCLNELGGPAFYMPIWAWAKLAGTSDVALRLPSVAMSVATPLLLAWRGDADRRLSLLWAAVVLLWLPSVPDAIEARAYAQSLLLGCAQAMLFLPLARRVDTRIALAWSTVSALAILTHYYALLPTALQGLALIAIHRRRLLPCWPALAPFALMAAWMSMHLPFLLAFGGHRVAIYAPLPPAMLAVIPMMVFGAGAQGYAILLAIVGAWRPGVQHQLAERPERWLAWTGVLACLLLIILGFIKASFAPRYMIPAAPSLLFGIALWLRTRPPRQWPYAAIVVAAMLLSIVGTLRHGWYDGRRGFVTEQASDWLMERHPSRLLFAWTTPSGDASDAGRLGEVAGFFFARARHPVVVTVVRPRLDPNAALLAAAGTDPGTAILWVADMRQLLRWRPSIDGRAGWQCRDFGNGEALVYACRRT